MYFLSCEKIKTFSIIIIIIIIIVTTAYLFSIFIHVLPRNSTSVGYVTPFVKYWLRKKVSNYHVQCVKDLNPQLIKINISYVTPSLIGYYILPG